MPAILQGKGKSPFSQVLDLPLIVAAGLTAAFYYFVTQPSMHGSILQMYTTEHAVEYVVMAFFIWGLTDVAFRCFAVPKEMLALKQELLPKRTQREPAARAAALEQFLQSKPRWVLQSRLGRRFTAALYYLTEKGSAEGLDEYLRHLSDQDHEQTHTNYGLIRFMCGITPMFGFLGTVVHFGTALGGQKGPLADNLTTVVSEMGTAFHTTTIALVAATTMMFALFICERAERAIVFAIDRRIDHELLNRFEVVDASMTPYLSALQIASRATLQSVEAVVERQLAAWSGALESLARQSDQLQQRQSQIWREALEKLEHRCESNDQNRELRLVKLLEAMQAAHAANHAQVTATVDHVATLKADFSTVVEQLNAIASQENRLAGSQAILAENLRILRETEQIDQALHGLTAAIHLLTARAAPHGGARAA